LAGINYYFLFVHYKYFYNYKEGTLPIALPINTKPGKAIVYSTYRFNYKLF